MARRLRQITVGSARYLYTIGRLDEHHIVLRIWAAERKRRDFPLEVRLRFDDVWRNLGILYTAPPEKRDAVFQLTPLQPGEVRAIIEAAIATGWGPHHPRDRRRFSWDRVGALAVW